MLYINNNSDKVLLVKRAGLPNSHLLHFYITVIRPVLEYCAPVWHYALMKAQSESLEAVQNSSYPHYT